MKIVPCLLSFFITSLVFSQNILNLDNTITLTTKEGLSNNAIMAIEKDHEGYMWIGTGKGLNKFDGERFSFVHLSEYDSLSISKRQITALEKDKDGYLWIATREGISRYNYKTKQVERMYLKGSAEPISTYVFSIHRMKNGDVWFGCSGEIFIYKKQQDEIKRIHQSVSHPEFFNNRAVYKIYQDSEEQIWFGSNRGVYKVRLTDKNQLYPIKVNTEESKFNTLDVHDIIEDGEKNIWIGTQNKGLLVYDRLKNVLKNPGNTLLSEIDVRSLAIDHVGNLWIAHFAGCLQRDKNGTIRRVVYKGEAQDRVGDGLASLYTDDSGTLWIGGYNGGLKVWNDNFGKFEHKQDLRPRIDMDLGLVNAIAEDHLQRVYIGTKKNGIAVLAKNGSYDTRLTKILRDRMMGFTVKSFFYDGQKLWIATVEKGMFIFDCIKEQFVDEAFSQELKLRLNKSGRIYSVTKHKDIVAFGTLAGGLILYDLEAKEIMFYPKNFNIKDKRLGNIRVVYFDKIGNLWIGTTSGMLRIDSSDVMKDGNVIKRFDLNTSGVVPYPEIMCIAESQSGHIFIGTAMSGFFKTDVEKKTVQNIELLGAKADSDAIFNIVEDSNATIWFSVDKGIIRYDPSKKEVLLYDQNYGVADINFRNQSSLLSSQGIIYFGSSDGVVYFRPDQLGAIKKSSTVLFTDFKIYQQENDGLLTYQSLLPNIKSDHEIVLAHDQTSFSINFSALDYSKIMNNSYEYRLLGLHTDWKTTSIPEVNYILQKSGNYTFQVRNKKLYGSGNNEISTLPIQLRVAPWKSKYAITAYLLLFLISTFWFFRISKSKTDLKHQLELENLEKIKEKERYTSQIEFFTNLSHDFRTPLTLILAPLQQLLDNYKGKNTMYTKLLTIKRNAGQLLHLTNQLLDFKKIESDKPDLRIEKGNVVALVEDVFMSFQELSRLKNNTYTFHYANQEIELYYDFLLLERVFYNLISNAFKNSKKGDTISVGIKEDADYVFIEIIDTGRGIDEESLQKIFDRFFKATDPDQKKKFFAPSIGIGLHIVKKIIDQHKGKIHVESREGKGTTFQVILKKGIVHLMEYNLINTNKKYKENKIERIAPVTFENKIELQELENAPAEDKNSILVVEDNDEMRKFLVNLLSEKYHVEQAADGRKGFIKALQKNIDIIISDVVMPGISGTEFCYKIKNDDRTRHMPFIMLTSRSLPKQKIAGLKSGADVYITKPFDIEEFLLQIENLLQTSQPVSKGEHNVITTDPESSLGSSEDEKLYKKAIKIVNDNLGNSDFDIDTFSAELGISRTQLYRKVKNWTNQTPKDLLQSIRLKKAAQLLETSDKTISQICYEVGFANPKYFARCFKKQFKQTPSEYSKKFFDE